MSTDQNDLLLEHTYDDIQEFDNPLPGWWVGIFWLTIIYSVVYFTYYHIGIGGSVHDEYSASATEYFEKQAALMEGMEVTEESIAAMMNEKVLLDGMRQKFEAKCATCHGMQAQGMACPNLTDDHWLNGGSLVQIHKTIRDGVPGKEMKSWMADLGPAGVVNMAAYVGSLRGTHVSGGKSPEGELYEAGR